MPDATIKGKKMSAFDKLISAVNKAKQSGGNREDKEVFYYPQRDAAGNGGATIKFLPGVDGVHFVKTYNHGFKSATNKWLIEECPTTIEKDCPVCEANSKLYAQLTKDEARKHGMNRKTSFIARILVIEDKKTPENEGKVFMFKFGKKIFDKLVDGLQPVDEDDEKLDVFGLKEDDAPWTNFKLKIRKVDNETNYDKSEFEKTESKVSVDFKSQYSDENDISKFLDESKFKTVEQLQKRLDIVLGNTIRVAQVSELKEEDAENRRPPKESTRIETPTQSDDDDDIMAMIQGLANDD